MSTPSLASNLDNIPSAILDSKASKHLNSSEAFQSFLLKSPYTSPTRVLTSQPQRNTYYLRKGEEDNSQNNEDILEYLSPKKRACLQSESLSTIAPKSKRLGDGEASSLGFLDFCEAQGSSKSKLIIDDCDGENQSSATQQQMHIQRKLRAVQGYSRGFECPNMENLDKETRKYIEGLQERVVRLERDTVKLKRENYELNAKNKKYEEKMISVVQEQERFMKMREDYEKTIASLRENCQSNKVIADSLKDVLAMQEGEFYDRVVKKEKGAASSATNTKTTRSSSKVSQNRINSIPSLEAILDSQKEGKGKTERKKMSIKVNTAKSVSKSSMTSLNIRKASTLSIGNDHENCFKTAEVMM